MSENGVFYIINDTHDEKYNFWKHSIMEEIDTFDKTPPSDEMIYIDTTTVLGEAETYIHTMKPRCFDENSFIIMYCEMHDKEEKYIGHVFYNIHIENKIRFFKDDHWNEIHEPLQVLFFLSIYKSTINKCNTCNKKSSFSRKMLSFIENLGIENNCFCLMTSPIGIMRNILLNNGFNYGTNGVIKVLEYTHSHKFSKNSFGGKRKSSVSRFKKNKTHKIKQK